MNDYEITLVLQVAGPGTREVALKVRAIDRDDAVARFQGALQWAMERQEAFVDHLEPDEQLLND